MVRPASIRALDKPEIAEGETAIAESIVDKTIRPGPDTRGMRTRGVGDERKEEGWGGRGKKRKRKLRSRAVCLFAHSRELDGMVLTNSLTNPRL
jgi:hypothetical protein